MYSLIVQSLYDYLPFEEVELLFNLFNIYAESYSYDEEEDEKQTVMFSSGMNIIESNYSIEGLLETKNIYGFTVLVGKEEYEYNADKQPEKITTTVMTGENSGGITTIQRYEYDINKDMAGYYSPLAEGLLNDEYKTTVEYDLRYHMMVSAESKKDAETTLRTEYILTNDGKSVSEINTYENEALKTKAELFYDQYGNNISVKIYGDDFEEYTEVTNEYDENGLYQTGHGIDGVYDADGNPLEELKRESEYDILGNITTTVDRAGTVTEITYDFAGRVSEVSKNETPYLSIEYNDDERSIILENAIGQKLKKVYGTFGKEKYNAKIDPQTGDEIIIGRQVYNAANQLIVSHVEGKNTTRYYYGIHGEVRKMTVRDSGRNIVSEEEYTSTYDETLMQTKRVKGDVNAPSLSSTTYTDKFGNVIAASSEPFENAFDFTQAVTLFEYDYVGNNTSVALTADIKKLIDDGEVIDYENLPKIAEAEYDYQNNLIKMTNAEENEQSFEFDGQGQQVGATDFKGNKAEYEYDKIGRLIVEKTPFETIDSVDYYTITKYYYDNANNVICRKTTNNEPGEAETWSETTYTYDENNKITSITANDGSTIYYTYDEVGKILSVENGGEIITYEYDEYGRQISLTDAEEMSEYYE